MADCSSEGNLPFFSSGIRIRNSIEAREKLYFISRREKKKVQWSPYKVTTNPLGRT